MKDNAFIVDVPAGAENQGYDCLFKPSQIGPQFGERWSICVKTDIARAAAGDLAKYLPKPGAKIDMIPFGSNHRPSILASRNGRPLAIMQSANFFEATFHDLHWIGLTPDRVIRHVEKKLFVEHYFVEAKRKHAFVLRAVMIDADGIEESYKRLSDEMQSDLRE